jgi:succinate dehydrogenase/fumarate reductase-like Fe-S protein
MHALCLQEFQIYRWSPDAPEQPKYVSYKVDINACGPMMLDVLLKIKDEQDQSLAFRRSCRCANGCMLGFPRAAAAAAADCKRSLQLQTPPSVN